MKHTKCYLKDYPRPQLVRKRWQSLNGEWDFIYDDNDEGEALKYPCGFSAPLKINVPFVYQCGESGIGSAEEHACVWYQLKFKPAYCGGKAILVFEGCDNETSVWLNGTLLGTHVGAYARFSFDATNLIKKGDNLLVVRARDDRDCRRMRGKQSWINRNIECFYEPCTGIYKGVWLDYPQSETYLEQVKITPQLDDYSVSFDLFTAGALKGVSACVKVSYDGLPVSEFSIKVNKPCESVRVNLESDNIFFKVKQWSPATPNLYDVEFLLERDGKTIDEVGSYFAMRDIRIDGNKILLNNNATYFKLVLDQGYYPNSLLTPHSEEELIRDIELTKAMGFNGVRKHQKTEDERYFYYADVLGLFVWCEMPSNYVFDDKAIAEIQREWAEIVPQYYNHPSVVCWVLFNESWGVGNISRNVRMQNFSKALYYFTKSIDPYRPVVSNDGWEHTKSDILTIHQYQQDAEIFYSYFDSLKKTSEGWCCGRGKMPFAGGFCYEGQPIMITEYGGTSFADRNESGWGYGAKLKNAEEFFEKFASLTRAVKKIEGCSGYCYTQLTDVRQEINGLAYEDRTLKIEAERIKKINDEPVLPVSEK